ncbi:uncharacterized protein C2orf81 homolog [Erpetoichthys calabaricus]|uniref:uncharacterized protein C2orf81 homolog n=1 Tax=Erpetoichthys calabaricus TaxID=27687 RepID=UPI00223449FC|nr:uncharacterized protein C2orf81 homolog [Erpetoichthys calabaricus]XP_051786086.1 uncharacterized protein C2orf81 homolog [Erpetoichthys calabaricus]
MSRSVHSKSRLEKPRVPSAHASQVVNVTATPDIVPGRLTEQDWLSMVAKEEGENVVSDILEELLARVMEQSLNAYVQRELIPYTVSNSYKTIVQVIQCRFMEPDKGENVECNPTWEEDEEPMASRIDSWASGAVPVIYNRQKQHSTASQVCPEPKAKQNAPLLPKAKKIQEGPNSKNRKLNDANPRPKKSENIPANLKPQTMLKPIPPINEKKVKREYQRHRGPLRSAGLRHITKPLEVTEKELLIESLSKSFPAEQDVPDLLPSSFYNVLKIQAGRPPQRSNTMTFDKSGNVISVGKLDPIKLPRNKLEVTWEVVDPSEKTRQAYIDPLQPLGHMQSSSKVQKSRELKTSLDVKRVVEFSISPLNKEKYTLKRSIDSRKQNSFSWEQEAPEDRHLVQQGPLPVPGHVLWDSIELSPGVTIIDPTGNRRSALKEPIRQHSRGSLDGKVLRPIQSSIQQPLITAEQIVSGKATIMLGTPVVGQM